MHFRHIFYCLYHSLLQEMEQHNIVIFNCYVYRLLGLVQLVASQSDQVRTKMVETLLTSTSYYSLSMLIIV